MRRLFLFILFHCTMKYFFTLFALALTCSLPAQKLYPPTPVHNEILPDWAKEMYSAQPNVWRVDDAYTQWRRTHPSEKTTYTQYYKKWRRAVTSSIDHQGFIQKNQALSAQQPQAQDRNAVWSCMGPFETFNTNTGPNPLANSSQANIYCIDQSPSNPEVLYCASEGAELFKSVNRGQTWTCISRNLIIASATALEVHPSNPDIVLVGEGSNVRLSTDGGNTWQIVLTVADCSPNEILFNPADPNIVLAATWKGLFRSTNGGLNWLQLFPEPCYDIDWKTDDPTTAFLLRNDPAARICRFYKSTDSGINWTNKENGWYFSEDSARSDGGARLAVSKADPNRVYVVLIGEAKAGDDGFIGIYRSEDAGESWTLPNAPAGGPYNDTDHPNMATIGATGGYHQGYYNLGLDVSDSNPNELLAGFLKLWRSKDGGKTFECIGGYCGNPFNYVHPDCQEIEINGDDVWMTSDGGIEHSTDFFETHYARNRGITSSDFWGFGAGWNEDVLVGGRYHNGNTAWKEGWEAGEHLALGGGEASTGYVNPGTARTTYFSDLGKITLPVVQNGFVQYAGFGKFPTESYYEAESGEMEWDPRCWNTIFVTNENNLWRTEDGGSTWEILHTFGTDPTSRTMGFEISRSNPDVMYLFQRASYSWDPGNLWKTTDGGLTWFTLPLPSGYARRMLLTLDPENENRIWAAYPDGSNGQKIFQSTDGGNTWQNRSTNAFNDQTVTYILHQGGTQGGVYVATYRSLYYRNDNQPDWINYADGLPASISTCILRPFYRDNKLRIGAYGKGIWEAPWYELGHPVAQPMVNKRYTDCPGDFLQFDDYSMLSHEGASWLWQFPGGLPTSSTLRNPTVLYKQPGNYDVTLTVTNALGSNTKTVQHMVQVGAAVTNNPPVEVDFSNGPALLTVVNPDGGITWEPVNLTSCEPNGDTAYFVNNYVYSSYGQDELLFPINLDLSQMATAFLRFDVAYAPYFDGNAFIDSLLVQLSDDCGATTRTLFRSGGEALSTTTSGIGANNLYEYDAFSPQSCEEWRTIEIDLSEFLGRIITLRMINKSGYGNNMYIDNISFNGDYLVGTQTTGDLTMASLRATPNPASGQTRLKGTAPVATQALLRILDATGRTVDQRKLQVPSGNFEQQLSIENLPAGVYWIKLSGENGAMWPVTKLVVN